MKMLIYSFEKFQNLTTNPAFQVAKKLREKFDSKDFELIELPVTYDCWEILKNKIDEVEPEFVLGIGVAIGINRIKIEKIGLNYKHAEIPDNKGVKISSEKINNDWEIGLETNVDVLKFVEKMKEKNIPTEISFHAGTYICNYAYYNCLKYLKDKNVKTLFIHVPSSPEETIRLNMNVASFPTDLIAEGIYYFLGKV